MAGPQPSPADVPRARSARTWSRRSRSLPATLLAAVVGVPLIAVALPVLAAVDLLRGRRVLPTVRLAVFGVWYLCWEVVAMVSASALWIATGFGRRLDRPWSLRAHHWLQKVWVDSLLGAAQRTLGLDLDIDGGDAPGTAPADGPLIVLCRHTSMVDTLVPAQLLARRGYRLRYVMKDDLLWDPALDLIGQRLPNYFVDRSSTDMAGELAGIRALAETAGPSDALIIFPEGTRWSPAKREAALARLRDHNPALADRCERLRSVLPPRPAGTLALLDARPDADVVILNHTGLEGLAGPGDAVRILPLRRPMQVTLRRVRRADIPTSTDAQAAWLLDEWDEVDAWVTAQQGSGDPDGSDVDEANGAVDASSFDASSVDASSPIDLRDQASASASAAGTNS